MCAASPSARSVGFPLPLALVALAVGPGELLYWTVLGNGRYLELEHRVVARDRACSSLMTLAFAAVQPPDPLDAAARVARARARSTRRDDIDLWLWLVSGAVSVAIGLRFFGHYYLQLVPPLCLLAASALVARAGARRKRHDRRRASLSAVAFSAAGFFMRPFGAEPEYEPVSPYLAAQHAARPHPGVGQRARDLLGVGAPARHAFHRDERVARRHDRTAGRPATERHEPEDRRRGWKWFFEDLARTRREYILDSTPRASTGASRSRATRPRAHLDSDYRTRSRAQRPRPLSLTARSTASAIYRRRGLAP